MTRSSNIWLVLMAGLTACAVPVRSLEVREVASPAAANSAQPNLSDGGDGRVLMSWIEEGEDAEHVLRFSSWGGAAWSPPATVARGTDWFVNWADFPSVTSLDDGTLVAHWLQKTGDEPYAYAVMLSRSEDGGRTWGEPVCPHDPSPTEHGFVSTVSLTGGRAAIIWLDGRETGGGHEGAGAMTLRAAILEADGAMQRSDVLDGRVCDCCQTSAAGLPKGDVVVVYRDRSDTEIRDTSIVTFDGNRWSDPRPVFEDGWEIAGCPVNGPAVAAQGSTVAVAWFTAAGTEGTGHVRLALSDDGGRSFDPPREVGVGRPLGRVDVVLLEDGSPVVTWVDGAADEARIMARRMPRKAPAEPPLLVADTTGARAGGFPRTARSGSMILVAWPDASSRRVRTAVIAPAGD